MASNLSPVRSSNEDLIRDGLLDLNEITGIIRNPDHPKSRLHMKNIIKRYNEEKRRAFTLSRIRCTANSSYLTTNCENDCEEDLMIRLLSEVFSKYENEIHSRSERKDSEFVRKTNVSVKEEVVSDGEDDCLILEDIDENIINNLKQMRKNFKNKCKSVEKDEIIATNNLVTIDRQLEEKLSALTELRLLCETLIEQRNGFTQKCDDLQNKKNQLNNQIKEMDEKILNYNQKITSNKDIEFIDISDDLSESDSNLKSLESLSINKKKNSNEFKANKAKPKKNNRSPIERIAVPKKLKNISTQRIRTENTAQLLIECNQNIINEVNDNALTLGITDSQLRPDSGLTAGDDSQETPNSVDLMQNDINFAFKANGFQRNNGFSPLLSPPISPLPATINSSVVLSSTDTSCHSLSISKSVPKSSINSSIRAQNVEAMDTTPISHSSNMSNKVTKRKIESNNNLLNNQKRNNANNGLNTDYQTNGKCFRGVGCLHIKDNEIYVGLQTGVINKYNICDESLQMCDSFPQLDSGVSALHLIKPLNYLYCGTYSGLFAYLNCASNNKNYVLDQLCPGSTNRITCFENNATILFIGTKFGFIRRFGLMSNEWINEFKCGFSVKDLKLMNDSSERLIVCGKNEISIRNSTDGSLLQTLRTENTHQLIGAKIFSNNIIICSLITSNSSYRFQVCDNSFRVINEFEKQFSAKLVTFEDNLFYVLTWNPSLYCFDIENMSFLWSIKINYKPNDLIRMSVDNKRIIIGTRFETIFQIIADSTAPIVCQSNGCGQGFPRISDIVEHFRDVHANNLYNGHTNVKIFECQWNGCHFRIKNKYQSIQMIVEHMKTHVI